MVKRVHISKIAFIVIMMILFISRGKDTKLDSTISMHMTAIQNRDLPSLLKTVDDDKITLILPNGKYSTSFSEYEKINQEWFDEEDWNIKYDVLNVHRNKNSAIVLTKITYFDKDDHGSVYNFQYFLTMIFEYKMNKWQLIYDQNTMIK